MGRVAVIAGTGDLPAKVAASLAQRGDLAGVVAVNHQPSWADDYQHTSLTFGQLGKLWSQLRKWQADQVAFAGGVSERPDFKTFQLDLGTVASLPKVVAALVGGDDKLLRAVADIFAAQGFPVLSLGDCVPDLLAGGGQLGTIPPTSVQTADLEEAYTHAKALGALDAGQAAVVERGRSLALEAAEGTDRMLERVAELRTIGRLSSKGGGVLVKCAKPKQDLRFDLPTIGMRTLELASAAGLSAIGVEQGRTIILGEKRLIETANVSGIALWGFAMKRDRHG